MPRTEKPKPAPKGTRKGVDTFRALHDKSFIIPKRIREALANLGDGWEYEADFMRLAQVAAQDLSPYRSEFEDHIVVVNGRNPKRVWCGTKALAVKLRGMV